MAENTIIHEISLAGYKATSTGGMLDLGTWGSYGIEKLHLTLDAAWQDLTITAFFNVNGKVVAKRVVGKDGYADVPWEATKENTFAGCLAFEGSINGQRRISTNLNYKVTNHSETTDSDPVPTDDRWNQFVTETKEYRDGAFEAAERANARAEDAETASEDAQAAARAAKASENAAAASASNAAASADKAGPYAKAAQAAQKGAEAARDVAAKSAEAAAKSEANVKQSADTLAESVKNITPDDSSIGDKPWSSKHIIDMLCPPLEESGNPVVCYPVAGYALGVKAMWEPAQEGTGTPSPENIRPIKGRDSVMVDRCGENVIEFLSTEDSSSDIKIAVDAEKNITLNGTLAGKGNITIGTCRLHWVAGKTYTMYVKKVGGSVSLGSGDGITFAYALFTTDYNHFFRGGTNSTNLDVYIASDAALVETELVFMLQCWRKGTVFNNFKFQIEVVEGTTAPTTYTPYIGQTNTLTLPETVYGGEVDAVSSEGQETQKLVILNGTESWNSWGINAHNPAITGFYTYDINDYDAINSKGICSHLETPNQDVCGGRNAGIGFATVGSSRYFMFSMLTSSLPDISAGHEVVSLKAYLAAQNDAGTPVQIAYKLAEPVPFTATGAQPLSALAGVNTVLTDADSANVTGRADPIKRIADLEDAVASIN